MSGVDSSSGTGTTAALGATGRGTTGALGATGATGRGTTGTTGATGATGRSTATASGSGSVMHRHFASGQKPARQFFSQNSSSFEPAAHLLNFGLPSAAAARPTNSGQLPPSDSSSVAASGTATGAATFSFTIASRAFAVAISSR